MQKKLTELQAFNAMAKLFKIYSKLDPSGDIGGILGSMSFLRDKKPVDRAMLRDWNRCIRIFLGHKNLRNYNYLTPLQAFWAIGPFLEFFFGTTDVTPEIKFLQENMRLAQDKKIIDLVLWQNWLQCVDEVLLVKDSRYYLNIIS